jgi:hypothetical protein
MEGQFAVVFKKEHDDLQEASRVIEPESELARRVVVLYRVCHGKSR